MRRQQRALTQLAVSGQLGDGHGEHLDRIATFLAVAVFSLEQIACDIHEELRGALVHLANLLPGDFTGSLGHLRRLRRSDANKLETTLALDVRHRPLRPRRAERDADTGRAGSPRATRSVNVRLGILWRFALNDELDAVDVQTSRRDVGGDQDLKLIIAESSQNNLALTLIHVAVKRLGPLRDLFL